MSENLPYGWIPIPDGPTVTLKTDHRRYGARGQDVTGEVVSGTWKPSDTFDQGRYASVRSGTQGRIVGKSHSLSRFNMWLVDVGGGRLIGVHPFQTVETSAPQKPQGHIQIRPSSYRGIDGFSVTGTDAEGHRNIRIFTMEEVEALSLKRILKDPKLTSEQRSREVDRVLKYDSGRRPFLEMAARARQYQTRRGREQDERIESETVAWPPADVNSPRNRKLIERWRRDPSQLDLVGIDNRRGARRPKGKRLIR